MNIPRLNSKLIKSLHRVLFIPVAEMKAATGIADTTWYRIMDAPDQMAIKHLLQLANGLHIPVRRFFTEGRADVIGRRDDYITAPYQSCHYDGSVIHAYVNSSPAATWQRAADTIGISRSRLRNSLLAVTRTPVARFLAVCNTFEIDPFTVLIDPNPKLPRKNGRTPDMANDTCPPSIADCATILRQLADLQRQVADLSERYDTLLAAHNVLAHRVSANIEHLTGSHLSRAAEPESDYSLPTTKNCTRKG